MPQNNNNEILQDKMSESSIDKKISELLEKLEAVEDDKMRVEILNRLSSHSRNSDHVKAMEYARKALKISQKAKHKRGMAISLSNIGLVYRHQGEYSQAAEYYQKALEIAEKLGDTIEISICLNNFGEINREQGNYPKALEFYQKSLSLLEETDDRLAIARCLNNIGIICLNQDDKVKAISYYKRSLQIFEILDNKQGTASCLHNIGVIYHQQAEYRKALEHFQQAMKINEEIGNVHWLSNNLICIGSIHDAQDNHPQALDYYRKSLEIYKKLQDKYSIAGTYTNIAGVYTKLGETVEAIEYCENALCIAQEIGALDIEIFAYSGLSHAYETAGKFQKALEYYKHFKETHDAVFNEEKSRQITEMQTKYETEKKEKEAEIYRLKNVELVEANRIIEEEKAKSEKLLLNILPVRVANDLKENGKSEPESFDNVTVYFSDIVDFTKLSANLEPKYLIDELSDIFTAFDKIMETHHCERIKTIGDAYIAVCGMPNENENHAENIVNAALEIGEYLTERNKNSKIEWQVRIGIHSGKVVGGIVGIKKYIYDVFGDTINTASRMQTNSEPMKINISETTCELIKSKFKLIDRIPLEVKGKGKMRMYFVK